MYRAQMTLQTETIERSVIDLQEVMRLEAARQPEAAVNTIKTAKNQNRAAASAP